MDRAVKRYIIPSIMVIVIASSAYLLWANNQQPSEVDENVSIGVTAGYRARDLLLTGLDGETIKLSDYLGSILIIDFMAPWCNPCKEQIKILKDVEGTPDVMIISINVDSEYNATYLQRFKEQEGMSWPLASSSEAAQYYKVTAIPLIIFVDKEGVIRYRGYYTTLTQFEQLIKDNG
ncbi:MAG: TlpA disulfide reductase family protein [Candidatus Bathyarchaeota archaeon]